MDWHNFYLGFFLWLTSSGLLLGLSRSKSPNSKKKKNTTENITSGDNDSPIGQVSPQQLAKIKELETELASKNQALNLANSHIEKLETRFHLQQKQTSALEQQLGQTSDELQAKTIDLQKQKQLEDELASKTQALNLANSHIEKLETRFHLQQNQTSALEKELQQKSDELQAKTIDFQRQIAKLEEEVKTNNQQVQKDEDKWQQKQQKLQDKTAFYQAQITALTEELELTSDQLELTQNKYFNYQQDLQQQISNYQDKIDLLQAKNKQLVKKLKQLPTQLKGEWQKESIALLKELLVHYPTAKLMVELKHHLPSKNLIGLLKPLEKLLQTWEVETIGEPWKRVPYNPLIHDCGEEKINQGDPVYIRWVGYYQGDRVLLPAKVSRKLPKQRNRG